MSDTRRAKTFRGNFPDIGTGIYVILIAPIAIFKQFMTQLYDLIVHMIWSTTTQGRTYEQFAILLALVIFCLLSLLSYCFRNYDGLLIIGSFLVWFLDYLFTQSEYLYGKKRVSILLTAQANGNCIWQQRSSTGKSRWVNFQIRDIKQVLIVQTPIVGGAFQTLGATAWQVKIIFCRDDSELLIYQEETAAKAFQKSKELASYFEVSLVFAHSQGQGCYAADSLDLHQLRQTRNFPQTIRVRSSAHQWRINSHWHLSSSWLLLCQIIEQSGFLLFVVVIINLMICVGKVQWAAIAILSKQASLNAIDLTYFNIPSWLMADFDWFTVGEFVLAVIIMVFKGAELSQEEHLCVTRRNTQFFLNHQKIAEIPTSQIEATLFIQQPQPMILIVGDMKAIEIPGLQQEIEFRAMLLKLDDAIAQFQSSDQ
jgi:hypothetical protein